MAKKVSDSQPKPARRVVLPGLAVLALAVFAWAIWLARAPVKPDHAEGQSSRSTPKTDADPQVAPPTKPNVVKVSIQR